MVLTLLLAGNSLYVGGSFINISGVARQRLAALEPLSGSAQAFNAGTVDGNVNALTLNPPTLYVGGNFNQIGGSTRFYIAALKASTGLATVFSSSTNGLVNALANVKQPGDDRTREEGANAGHYTHTQRD